jgi:Flp pilus assembly protein CpaB
VLWYAAAVALTVATGLVVDSALRRAEATEAALGRTRSVVVVARPVAAGDALDEGDVRVERWPVALVPDGAADRRSLGEVALVDLWPGEPLLADRIGTGGADGVAALVDAGRRAVPVPVVVPGLPLDVGDRVDVLAGGAAGGGPAGDLPGSAPAADLVAADATVVHVDEEAVVVSVSPSAAVDVAAALASGPVVLALRPPGG